MKTLIITIRSIRRGTRIRGWFAEINAPDRYGVHEKLFERREKRQVIKLVERMRQAQVEIEE